MRLKEIAEALYIAADYMPETSHADDDPAVFRFGPLTLRCRPDAPSVRRMAAKYDVTGVTLRAGFAGGSVRLDERVAADQRFNERGEPYRSQSVNARWFSDKPVPLSQAGEGRGKR